jgi:uncharacterized membrane protein
MRIASIIAAGLVVSLAVTAGCERNQDLSFAKDVKPVIDEHCSNCHAKGQAGYEVSGFASDSYASLLKGTKFGPVVIPGDSFNSTLVVLIEGRADPSINMPHGTLRELRSEEIDIIRRWIDGGAMND